MFGQESLKANGRDAVGINPFAIRRLEVGARAHVFVGACVTCLVSILISCLARLSGHELTAASRP